MQWNFREKSLYSEILFHVKIYTRRRFIVRQLYWPIRSWSVNFLCYKIRKNNFGEKLWFNQSFTLCIYIWFGIFKITPFHVIILNIHFRGYWLVHFVLLKFLLLFREVRLQKSIFYLKVPIHSIGFENATVLAQFLYNLIFHFSFIQFAQNWLFVFIITNCC